LVGSSSLFWQPEDMLTIADLNNDIPDQE